MSNWARPGKTAIYALADSRTLTIVNYGGRAEKPVVRFRGHLDDRRHCTSAKARWIKQVVDARANIVCLLIEWVDQKVASLAEQYWLHTLWHQGQPLTNWSASIQWAKLAYQPDIEFLPIKAEAITAGPNNIGLGIPCYGPYKKNVIR